MKTSVNERRMLLRSLGGGRGVARQRHQHAVAQLEGARGRDQLAGLEPILDQNRIAQRLAGPHLADVGALLALLSKTTNSSSRRRARAPPSSSAGGRSGSCSGWRSRSRSRSSGWPRSSTASGSATASLRDARDRRAARASGSRCSCRGCGDRLEAPLSRLARFGPASARRRLLVRARRRRRARLRLRAVRRARSSPRSISVGAAVGRDASRSALAYALGSAVVLLALALGGRRLTRPRAARPGAPARARRRDDRSPRWRWRTDARRPLPDRDRRPPPGRARQPDRRRSSARRGRRRGSPTCAAAVALRATRRTRRELDAAGARHGARLHRQRRAGSTRKPLTLAALRGRVVLIDFWTYTCINCIRTLPYLRAWDARYRDARADDRRRPLARVRFEKDAGNVARRDRRRTASRYPVAQDNDYGDLERLGQPVLAGQVPDRRAAASVRYAHFGEGDYDEDRGRDPRAARRGGRRGLGARRQAAGRRRRPADATPETYLGSARAQRWVPPPRAGRARLPGARPAAGEPLRARRPLEGRPTSPPTAVPRRDAATRTCAASRLPRARLEGGRPRTCDVSVDGKPEQHRHRAPRSGSTRWSSLPQAGRARAELRFAPGRLGLRVHVRLSGGLGGSTVIMRPRRPVRNSTVPAALA